MEALHRRGNDLPGRVLVPDTNVLVQHPQELGEIDWPRLGPAADSVEAVHVAVPLVVIDELDRLKRSGGPEIRTRARTTSRSIDRLMNGEPDRRATLAMHAGGARTVHSTIDVLLDPLMHERLGSADAEIITRTLDLQQLVGKPVWLVSGDLGMRFRARAVGLGVVDPFEE